MAHGFFQEGGRRAVERVHDERPGGGAGDQDHGKFRIELADLLQRRNAIFAGHHHVEKHERNRRIALVEETQRLLSRLGQ